MTAKSQLSSMPTPSSEAMQVDKIPTPPAEVSTDAPVEASLTNGGSIAETSSPHAQEEGKSIVDPEGGSKDGGNGGGDLPPKDTKSEDLSAAKQDVVATEPTKDSLATATAAPAPESELAPDGASAAAHDSKPTAATAKETNTDEDPPAALPPTKVAREREDDDMADEPSTKRPKTEDASNDSVSQAQSSPPTTATQAPEPATASATSTAGAPTSAAVTEPAKREDWGDLTDVQFKRLGEGMRNLKKSKHSANYAKPVDPVALKLPTYFDIVKNPMDLGTMENKLKNKEYSSVADYVNDFNLMVDNAILFNGQSHVVSQAGMNMRAQLNAQLKKMPKPGEPAPPEANQKAKRTSLPAPATREKPPPREARHSFGATQSAQSPSTSFAPDANGVPLARRDSSVVDRPKRKIQKPAPRELMYPKTQKKKFKAELKFAEEVYAEMRRPRYNSISAAFLEPVDPVALNIPNYNQVIKHPMDMATIRQKLNDQQYENLKEFEADFRLMFKNCYKFNPESHPIHIAGREYEKVFNEQMAKKNDRIKALQPSPSTRETPDEESEEESSEEEEEPAETDQQKQLRLLNAQLAALSEQASKLMRDGAATKKTKGSKDKKAKPGKPDKKKKTSSGGTSVPRSDKKPKSKPKSKVKPLTQKEKEEISNRIFELPTDEINSVAEQIKRSMRERGIPVTDEQEMEFNIDDIPEEILRNILTRLRRNQPGAAKVEDDGYESPVQSYAPKGKRHRPMSRADTASQMAAIQQQINNFNGGDGKFCIASYSCWTLY